MVPLERREEGMTAILVVIGSVVAGAALGRWWSLALPLLGIGVFAAAHAALGPSWGTDTPVVAVALVSEVTLAAGVILRRRAARPA
jgi:hypothetical protein